MAINKETTVRVKVSLSHETKEALEAIAAKQGISLSLLIAEAAIERHLLNRRGSAEDSVRLLAQQIERLEERLREQQPAQLEPVEVPKKRKKTRKDIKLGIVGAIEANPVVATANPVVSMQHGEALEKGLPLHIDNLIARFGGDKCLKARLCQLGGRDGKLFEGDLSKAQKVEAVTVGLDPDRLPWMPTGADRVWWVQKDALSFVREVLGGEK